MNVKLSYMCVHYVDYLEQFHIKDSWTQICKESNIRIVDYIILLVTLQQTINLSAFIPVRFLLLTFFL